MATQHSVERASSPMELLQPREMSGSLRYYSTKVSSPGRVDGEAHQIRHMFYERL